MMDQQLSENIGYLENQIYMMEQNILAAVNIDNFYWAKFWNNKVQKLRIQKLKILKQVLLSNDNSTTC